MDKEHGWLRFRQLQQHVLDAVVVLAVLRFLISRTRQQGARRATASVATCATDRISIDARHSEQEALCESLCYPFVYSSSASKKVHLSRRGMKEKVRGPQGSNAVMNRSGLRRIHHARSPWPGRRSLPAARYIAAPPCHRTPHPELPPFLLAARSPLRPRHVVASTHEEGAHVAADRHPQRHVPLRRGARRVPSSPPTGVRTFSGARAQIGRAHV